VCARPGAPRDTSFERGQLETSRISGSAFGGREGGRYRSAMVEDGGGWFSPMLRGHATSGETGRGDAGCIYGTCYSQSNAATVSVKLGILRPQPGKPNLVFRDGLHTLLRSLGGGGWWDEVKM
jgi:hypothetical protein